MSIDPQESEKKPPRSSFKYSRRRFFFKLSSGAAVGAVGCISSASPHVASTSEPCDEIRTFLKPYVLERATIDRFLDPKARVWARFHPQYGYLLRNSMMRDGVDGAQTLARYESAGHRWQVNFRNESCRINTYGDSFTQGHQVGDGETWQEVLAAHFCEPIRNYGIGGFGVYQAYRRLLEIESTDLGAKHVILNIWGDDHLRSIHAWRWLTFPRDVVNNMIGEMFHANPWDHTRLKEDGSLAEVSNPCPTAQSLYGLCDADYVYDLFGRDEVVHVLSALQSGRVVDPVPLERMAAAAQFMHLDNRTPESTRRTVSQLYHDYAIKVGIEILKRLDGALAKQGKKLFVLLSHPSGSVWHHCAGKPADNHDFVDWHPQKFQDFLRISKIPFLDTVEKHVAEFRQFKVDAKHYVDRYFIGHYNPQGNHFFAFAIKDELRSWLDPSTPAYRANGDSPIRFEGYLPS